MSSLPPFSNSLLPMKISGLNGTQQYEAWKLFRFQFENYLVAAKVDDKDEERRVALLLHLLGAEVVPIFQSFNKDVKACKLPDLLKLFNDYFAPKKNTALERHKFLSRKQLPGEPLESFLTDLKNLAAPCEFKDLKDSLVRDIFILGLVEENAHIKERLLQEGDKDLNFVMDLARTIQMSMAKGEDVSKAEVMKVSRFNRGYKSQPQRSSQGHWSGSSKSKSSQSNQGTSGRCGQVHRNACPAVNAICHKCSRKDTMQLSVGIERT